MNKYIRFDAQRHYDGGFMLGAVMYVHRHFEDWPLHWLFCLDVGLWFIEVEIGKEES